jgi:hypothetical protein
VSQVLDYSAGFPGALTIAAVRDAQGKQRFVGAVRYIGLPGRTKCTNRNEYEDFSRHGLGMALVFEESAGNWRSGAAQGRVDGRRARDHANAIGFPANRPIYMAIDQDVVSVAEFASMIEYLRGAAESLGGLHVTGVYGEADVIDRARSARVNGQPVATWFWQTKAWSKGRVTAANLLQLIGTVYVGGIACDINDVLADDWGQHNAEDSMGAVEDLQAKLYKGADGVTRGALDHLAQGVQWSNEAVHAANAARDTAVARLDALTAAVAAGFADPGIDKATLTQIVNDATPDAAEIAAQIMPGLIAGVTDNLKAVLADVLGEDNADQAAEILRQIAAKLAA